MFPHARLRRHATVGTMLLALLGVMGAAQAAPVPAGSSQQAQGAATQDQQGQSHTKGQGQSHATGQQASPQAQASANAIGQHGTRAPVGLSPGPKAAGATAENPTPHAPPGKQVVPGSENPAGPASPRRTTLTGATAANAGPTGAVGSSFSHHRIELPGTGAEAQTGPGTKLARQALPYRQHSQAASNPNGYNPAELAPASNAPQPPAQGYHPSQVAGVGQQAPARTGGKASHPAGTGGVQSGG